MNDGQRGVIRNRSYAQQIRDFSGLRFGKITPTDIDVFLEFGNRLFVVIESKHGTAPLPYGQRLALERLVDGLHCPPERDSILLIASHNTAQDIDFANLRVVRFRYDRKWKEPKAEITVYNFVHRLLRHFGLPTGEVA